MRYVATIHKPNRDYSHVGGYAVVDAEEMRQVSWFRSKSAAEADAAGRNKEIEAAPVVGATDCNAAFRRNRA